MSRMTKFLKQKCLFEQAKRDSKGEVLLDVYGSVLYKAVKRIKCRKEECIKDVQTSNGAILQSSTRYFIDNSVEVHADDKLDGKTVLQTESYVNHLGHIEGYECYV